MYYTSWILHHKFGVSERTNESSDSCVFGAIKIDTAVMIFQGSFATKLNWDGGKYPGSDGSANVRANVGHCVKYFSFQVALLTVMHVKTSCVAWGKMLIPLFPYMYMAIRFEEHILSFKEGRFNGNYRIQQEHDLCVTWDTLLISA